LAHGGGKVVSPTNRPPLSPRKYSWYSFLLEANSTPGHSAAGKITSIKNSNDTIGNWTRDLPACSARFWKDGQFQIFGNNLQYQISMHEEIKNTLKSGNACYHSMQNLLPTSLLSN
jgi:hypothetical protein